MRPDVDENGVLNHGEFVAVTIHLQKMDNDEHFRIAFMFFDKDGSGYIELDELRDALADEYRETNVNTLNDIMREVDTDKDGRICYDEFVVMMKAGTDWRKCLFNYSEVVNGRIWVVWRNDYDVELIASSPQSITCKTKFLGQVLYFTAVYGPNDGIIRRQIWSHLVDLKQTVAGDPWILLGDFNVIASPEESSDFNGSQVLCADMRDFLDCMDSLEVSDHPYNGPQFTWSNLQSESFLARKLDRALVKSSWIDLLPHSCVEFLAPGVSDHCPILVWLERRLFSLRKPFKFFNFWVKHPNFLNIVEDSWCAPVVGNPMCILFEKLKRLKKALKALNASHFSDISVRVQEQRKKLEFARLEALSSGNFPANVLASLSNDLAILEDVENSDQSSRFFHSMVNKKNKQHTIRSLHNALGAKLETYEELSEEIVQFYKGLIGTADSNVHGGNVQLFQELFQWSFDDEAQESLVQVVTREEIKATMFEQESDKSPASSCFNTTTLVLVPKNQSPNHVFEFRPISCCIVFYKCISQILVKRLAPFLSDFISPSQCAFVKGWSITDNSLLAHKLVRGYQKGHISPRCTVELGSTTELISQVVKIGFWVEMVEAIKE
ncbi:hypothetical protein GQ457_16G024570 [Hibiscus cannabinus]